MLDGDMPRIEDHLCRYGIQAVTDYRAFRRAALDAAARREIDRLRRLRSKRGQQRFYDLTARSEVSGIVHSMKARTIAASGRAVAEKIRGRKRLLDLGCNVGYLTTWYARLEPDRTVLGVDLSQASIEAAENKARELALKNVSFAVADLEVGVPDGVFDAIIDTQTSPYLRLDRVLPRVKQALAPGGLFVSVVPRGSEEEERLFLNVLEWAGFAVQSVERLPVGETAGEREYLIVAAGSAL